MSVVGEWAREMAAQLSEAGEHQVGVGGWNRVERWI